MGETLRQWWEGHPYKNAAQRYVRGFQGAKVLGYLRGDTIQQDSRDLWDVGRNWIYTEVVSTGSSTKAVQAPGTTLPSFLQFTTGTTTSDSCQIQWAKAQTADSGAAGAMSAFAPFLCVTGRQLHFFCRLAITTTIGNAAFFVGLAKVGTTLLTTHAPNTSEMIGLYKASGAATVAGLQRASSTNTLTTLNNNTLVASTVYEFAMRVTDRTAVTYYVNGVQTGETTVTNMPANTVALSPTIGVAAGTGAAVTAQIFGMLTIQDGNF